MEVMEAIYARRSIRRYKSEDVPDGIIEQVIDAARYAPSAHNRQPWEFIITRDTEKKQKLNEGRKWTRFLPDTPVVIVVCARFDDKPKIGEGEKGLSYYCLQDTAAATQNLLLAAHSLGLGTCWVGDFDGNFVKELFSISEENLHPVAIVALGYPESYPPQAPKRKPVDEIIHWEKF